MDRLAGWWGRRRKAVAWVGVTVMILTILLVCLRRPWITSLPGVGVEMARPLLRESDLGPESAYRLLRAGVAQIARAELSDSTADTTLYYETVLKELGETVVRPRPPSPPPPAEDAPLFPEESEGQMFPGGRVPVWGGGWYSAVEKFGFHPWPHSPPPPAPLPRPPTGDMFTEQRDPDPHDLAIQPAAPWTLEQYQEVLRGVGLHQPALPVLDRALAAPDPQVPTEDSFWTRSSRSQWVRSLSCWLVISAHVQATAGDYAEAFRNLERCLGTGALISRGGGLNDHTAAWGCGERAAKGARVLSLQYPVPSAILRQAAANFLHEADLAEPFVECVRAELLPLRSFIPTYYDFAHVDLYGYPYPSTNRRERLLNRLAFTLGPLAGSTPRNTTRNLESLCQHWVVLAQQPYSAEVQEAYDAITGGWFPPRSAARLVLGTRDPIGYWFARFADRDVGWRHAQATIHMAVLRGTAIFLAVRAHELEHGSLPDTLEQLVPDYLPRVPIDPFSGQPFRYLRTGVPGLPSAAWAVYSVGTNCVDDGGTAYGLIYTMPFREPDLLLASQPYPADWTAKHPGRRWYPGGRDRPRIDIPSL